MKNMVTNTPTRNHQDLPSLNRINDFSHLMNYFWNYFDTPAFNTDAVAAEMEPRIQVTETKEAVNVTAELPGIDEKNLNLQISSDGYLSLCGEKKNAFEKADKDAYFSEISYGTFKRTIPLPWDLDYDKVSAAYNNGVLNISIPKSSEEKQKFKKIELSSSKN